MKTEPGLTAFFSNVQTYDMMTEQEKKIADHSWVEYAPTLTNGWATAKASLMV